VNKDLVKMLSV